ncbi:MAG: serine hydrolase [Clostridia bacterium]|nr:serine hydrolase [Clostridia bacterium]
MFRRLLSVLLAMSFLAAASAAAPGALAETSSSVRRTLRAGDSGEAVSQLKQDLRFLGYDPGSQDDVFDEDTRSAVKAFQKAMGLTRDGIVGKNTYAALDRALAESRQAAGTLSEETVRFLNTVRAESGAVCGTLVISKDGKNVITWSFGDADENTCFRSASVTKWVTAIGLMTLYDRGLLDLDRDISDYLPFTVRNPAWPDTDITARMLLSHTSSLSPRAEKYHPSWEKIGKGGYDPLFDESVQPGTKYAYADYNGALFGGLLEAISGESIQNYLDRTVFSPLGLTAAYNPRFLPKGTKTRDLLTPAGKTAISVRKDRENPYNNKADPRANNGYTVGRLYISTASLTRLAQTMLNGGELEGVRILDTDTVALMEADQQGLAESRYGLGTVRLNGFPGGTWYGHQGRYSGFSANVYYQRETGTTLALIMDGYDYQLEDNIVLPAVRILRNMEALCSATPEHTP